MNFEVVMFFYLSQLGFRKKLSASAPARVHPPPKRSFFGAFPLSQTLLLLQTW